ncbi:MAG: N-acetylmuramoyl-L-alanine amidase, partial [Acidimicrobiales bacterium]|nr:N-acetylmuramoyl-L-alanine amidase [Acidimicrobiales bacterium]
MTPTNPHAFIVAGQELAPPSGLEVTNHLDPDVPPFAGQSRVGRKVDELVIHESVTRSAASTVAALQRRKLGVHLIVAPDGHVFQHGDLAHARLAHAGGHNGPSVGVEVVN